MVNIDISKTISANIDIKKYEQFILDKVKEIKDFPEIKDHNIFISLSFVGTSKIKSLNSEYRDIDKKTDVLTFGEFKKSKDKILQGDIYICYEVAKQNAKKFKNTINQEILILIIHSLLHLFGYDHKNKIQMNKMENQEKLLLKSGGLIYRSNI